MALDVVTIRDAKTGSSARILPGLGLNCYSFSVSTAEGPLEALWSDPNLADGTTKPTRSGIPLLFPFAGRIGGTSFSFEGRRYELEAGDGQGNAIHGFVFHRPWRVTAQAADRVSGQFQGSLDGDSLAERWPADFRITAEYRVAGNALSAEFVIENPDQKPLPFGFGMHPYFRVPLGGGAAEDCIVTVGVGTCWELENLLPTGRTTAAAECGRLARGMRFGEMQLDSVFGGLQFDGGRLTSTIHDPASGRTLSLSFGEEYAACVVFNPPTRQAVCIEPYTTIPDPFRLRAEGVDPHLKILAPGEAFRTRVEMRVS